MCVCVHVRWGNVCVPGEDGVGGGGGMYLCVCACVCEVRMILAVSGMEWLVVFLARMCFVWWCVSSPLPCPSPFSWQELVVLCHMFSASPLLRLGLLSLMGICVLGFCRAQRHLLQPQFRLVLLLRLQTPQLRPCYRLAPSPLASLTKQLPTTPNKFCEIWCEALGF
jgi:hypothetical protein